MNEGTQTFLKILLKALIFLTVIIAIFLLVYPHTCFNMRHDYIVDDDSVPGDIRHKSLTTSEPGVFPSAVDRQPAPGVIDTNSMPKPEEQPPAEAPLYEDYDEFTAAQDAWDYNAVKLYANLEKEYAQKGPITKDTAAKITRQVMEEINIDDAVWSEIMDKANSRGWFDRARREIGSPVLKK